MLKRCVRVLVAAGLLAGVLNLSGCNTVAGVGQDISGSARTVQRAL